MQTSSNPISPFLVSFYQIDGQSKWERFCECTFRFNSECYLVNQDNSFSRQIRPLSVCQIIRNLVVVIFAALLIVPLVCMITTKWAARKYLMRHLQMNALEKQSADRRVKQEMKAADARIALDMEAAQKRLALDLESARARDALNEVCKDQRVKQEVEAADARIALDMEAAQKRLALDLESARARDALNEVCKDQRVKQEVEAADARFALDMEAAQRRIALDLESARARDALNEVCTDQRVKLETAALAIYRRAQAEAAKTVATAKLEAVQTMSTAIQRAYQALNKEGDGFWYKLPWKVISKTSLNGVDHWTLTRLITPNGAPQPGLIEGSLVDTMVRIRLQDNSVIYINKNLIQNSFLKAASTFSERARKLKRSQAQEAEKKYEDFSSSRTIVGLDADKLDKQDPSMANQKEVDMTCWTPKVMKHYLQLISGNGTLENINISEILELHILADYLSDLKGKRLIAECIDALIAFDPNFHANLLIAYFEPLPISSISLSSLDVDPIQHSRDFLDHLPELVSDLNAEGMPNVHPEVAYRFFSRVRQKQEELELAGRSNLWVTGQLRYFYHTGIGCEPDKKLADEIQRQMIPDNLEALLEEGKLSSWDCFILAAYLDLPYGLRMLLFRQSLDIPGVKFFIAYNNKNLPEAKYLSLMQEAADAGVGQALKSLSAIYHRGTMGVPRQLDRALLFNELALAKRPNDDIVRRYRAIILKDWEVENR